MLRRNYGGKEKKFNGKVDELESYLKSETGLERMEKAREYILANWTAARVRLEHKKGVKGCSAEGHVSHVLSKPHEFQTDGLECERSCKDGGTAGLLSECRRYVGVGKISEERGAGGSRGTEYEVLSATKIQVSEWSRHGELGKYVDSITHSLSLKNRKQIYFSAHIWGL